MKNLSFLLLLGLMTLTIACQSNQGASQDAATEAPKTETEPTGSSTTPSNAAYTTTVIKSDIPSPRKEMTGMIGGAKITVNYGSPSVKGRDLWGGLVPWGKVWRAGANEATTFTVSKEVKIGGETLAAGTYGFFIHPKEDGPWEVIFNEVAEQWGAYDYDSSKDVIRAKASKSDVDESSETLDFLIDGSNVILHWGKVQLPISVSS